MSNQENEELVPLSGARLGLRVTGLQYSAALIQCLDADTNPIHSAIASGFLRQEGSQVFLYTCWHVVTGLDPNHCVLKEPLLRRRHLKVSLQGRVPLTESSYTIGGIQEIVVPLYTEGSPFKRPLWDQDPFSRPHVELNAMGVEVPLVHDVVRLKMPIGFDDIATWQLLDNSVLLSTSFMDRAVVGEKCFVVGFPYGFSTLGADTPHGVALTRFIASDQLSGRRRTLLMESFAAPGMSGGPVFVERGTGCFLFGIYTGLVFPDHMAPTPDRATALGTVVDLRAALRDPSWFRSHDAIARVET